LNFYRRLYRLEWLQPVERKIPVPRGDYYVLREEDRGLVEKLNLIKVYENPTAQLVLAVPKH